MKHELTYRNETRMSRYGIDPNLPGIAGYPCLLGCEEHLPREHNGSNVFIYAVCSCGWENLVGDHIYASEAKLEGRLQHLQHQIDILSEVKV